MTPLRVAVAADDPLSADGAVLSLRECKDIEVLPAGRRMETQVLVVATVQTDDDTISMIRGVASTAVAEHIGTVLVTDHLPERLIFRAVSCGLTSVLPRREVTAARLVQAVRGAAKGHAEMPGVVLGELLETVRYLQREVLEPYQLSMGGLQAREVEVLRLLAEGNDTMEIARHLNYSERTVKNVLHAMMKRLNLRNRSHAVAFGLRCGAI